MFSGGGGGGRGIHSGGGEGRGAGGFAVRAYADARAQSSPPGAALAYPPAQPASGFGGGEQAAGGGETPEELAELLGEGEGLAGVIGAAGVPQARLERLVALLKSESAGSAGVGAGNAGAGVGGGGLSLEGEGDGGGGLSPEGEGEGGGDMFEIGWTEDEGDDDGSMFAPQGAEDARAGVDPLEFYDVCCNPNCCRALTAAALCCRGCSRSFCALACVVPAPPPAQRNPLKCGACGVAIDERVQAAQRAWEGGSAAPAAVPVDADKVLAPALRLIRGGLDAVEVRLQRPGVVPSLLLYGFSRKYGLSNAAHRELIELLTGHGSGIAAAASEGTLLGARSCRGHIQAIGRHLGSRGVYASKLDIKNAVGAGESIFFARQDLQHLVEMMLRDPRYCGAFITPRPIDNTDFPAMDSNTPGDSQVARELAANMLREWDAVGPSGAHTHPVRAAMEVKFPVGEYTHVCLPIILQLFVDGVACSKGLHVDLVNFMWKVCNLVPALARTKHAWLSGGCAQVPELGKRPSAERKIEVHDVAGRVFSEVGLQQLVAERNRPIVVFGRHSNGVLPSVVMGKEAIFYAPLCFSNWILDGGEIGHVAETAGCVLGPCLRPDEVGGDEVIFDEGGEGGGGGGGGGPHPNKQKNPTPPHKD